ncbi:DUF1266 domain-containing protein [Paenibacillus sp. MMS18-CY102]|uniref:DUF1266 domain-containing protein n=1 Tax=Paenibacillus sp. MMS18-CY102 TaxID=2682849 RepID=UPI00136618DA|nr:DUF1266 domain-containing protein [Paenibacillus sp. MMS18-CY102]MWC29675.1 DUF1266 domain-containing protein [Paenibacillus sp. MMS18-CY102]
MPENTAKYNKHVWRYTRTLCAICFHGNEHKYMTHYGLGKIRDAFLGRSRLKRKMYTTHKIPNVEAFRHVARWYLTEGNRLEFNEMQNRLSVLSKADRQKYMSREHADAEQSHKLMVANDYLMLLPRAGIMAYDFAWHIYLCQIGHAVGYLSKPEALAKIVHAATSLQQNYNSWHEFYTAFMAGHRFVHNDTHLHKGERLMAYMLTHPSSPARKLDWQTKLIV